MDLVRYPLDKCTDQQLLNRLMEECAEVIQAASKCNRFGWSQMWPGRGETNMEALMEEFHDVELCINELYRRVEDNNIDKD